MISEAALSFINFAVDVSLVSLADASVKIHESSSQHKGAHAEKGNRDCYRSYPVSTTLQVKLIHFDSCNRMFSVQT